MARASYHRVKWTLGTLRGELGFEVEAHATPPDRAADMVRAGEVGTAEP